MNKKVIWQKEWCRHIYLSVCLPFYGEGNSAVTRSGKAYLKKRQEIGHQVKVDSVSPELANLRHWEEQDEKDQPHEVPHWNESQGHNLGFLQSNIPFKKASLLRTPERKIMSRWNVLWTRCLAKTTMATRFTITPRQATLIPIGPSTQYLKLK